MLPPTRRILTPVLALTIATAQSGCARNPVTGNLQLALISEAQEIQMGQQAAQEVAATMGLVDDPALQQYVDAIGQRMATVSERPDLPWSFAVVDDPTPNAFALPGGPIFLTRGMMNLMTTEAQLATVLGHEIAHVTARHHVTSLSRQQLAQIGLGVGGILFPELASLGNVAGAGLQLLFLSHGREAERQADDLGFAYALGQSYDVREMALVFGSLQRLGEERSDGGVPSWLQTHPAPAERIASVEERLGSLTEVAGQSRIGRQPYLEQIAGLVYGEDPRNGFFRDGTFLHPELRFQIAFPGQWRTQNLSQMVYALSPRNDAAIQLTLSGQPSPEAAAQQFLSQQGLAQGQTARRTINGQPAVISTFRVQTQQGVLQGIVGFVSHEGRVYQLLGYAPLNAYPAYDGVFQQSIASFSPLTDPAILNTQPNRIDIVRTTETMTLSEFNRRYPSVASVDVEELAILNQVTGPEAVVPAGSLVKRVVGS